MKLIWIYIIAIIIAVSSLVVEKPSIAADFSSPASLAQIPHFSIEVFRNDSLQQQNKSLHVAQDFIPIVVIAYETNANQGFLHYLPLYDLSRPNPHFLLI